MRLKNINFGCDFLFVLLMAIAYLAMICIFKTICLTSKQRENEGKNTKGRPCVVADVAHSHDASVVR